MDIEIKIDGINLNISSSKMHKMIFLFNALENGLLKKEIKNIFLQKIIKENVKCLGKIICLIL